MHRFHISLFFSLILFLSGCSQSEKGDRTPPHLRLALPCEVRSLDPCIGVDSPSVHVIRMLFEGLMRVKPDGELEPAVAENYFVSEDYKTYIFYLRPTVWSNGEPVTAYDFEYAWRRVISANSGSLGAHNFYSILNVQEIIQGKKPVESAGFKALDAKTLRVDLVCPAPYFPDVVATTPFFPIYPKNDQEHPNWANVEGKDFVCNGPFALEKHRIEDIIVVTKNPSYWDAPIVKLDKIEMVVIQDPTTQLNMFEKGSIDWIGRPISTIPQDAIADLKKKEKVSFLKNLAWFACFMNTTAFPFQNKKIRQAFAYAIDRQSIVDYLLDGGETPAFSVLPDKLATQSAPFFEDNIPEKAKQLFEEGIKEIGVSIEDFPPITINFSPKSDAYRIFQALQQQWNKVLGIQVKLEQQEWQVHFNKMQTGNFQMGGMGWVSWLRDPIYIMQSFRYRSDGLNMSKWENKEYQDLLYSAEQEANPKKRHHFFHLAETLLMEEMPLIPLYFITGSYICSERLKGVYISELGAADFRWAYLEKEKR